MIIVATNRKGGSGKSSMASNLAGIFAETRRVLLVDLDEQGDSSSSLGIESTGEQLADAIRGRSSLLNAIRTSASGVDVAPGGEAMGYIAHSSGLSAVGDALETLASHPYGVVVIDCPPATSQLVHSAWRQATIALAPVDGPEALRAVTRLCHAWEDCHLDLSAIRVALTRHDGRRVLDHELRRQAQERFGSAVFETRIRNSIAVPESASWKSPLSVHLPRHPVTRDFRQLAEEVLDG